MELFYSLILGALQGMTEFLPISSSGHLVIAQKVLGFEPAGVLLEVFLHLGTLFAIVVYFRKKIFNLKINYLKKLVIATLPVIVVGLFFTELVESLFDSVFVVGVALIFTGLMNYFMDKFTPKKSELDVRNVFVVGIFQALAIIPGVSRSGSTIFSATAQGVRRKEAAEFSFLLSIPAVLGANIFELFTRPVAETINLLPFLTGFVSAFLSGILAIKLMLKLLEDKNIKVFSFYCLILGFAILYILN